MHPVIRVAVASVARNLILTAQGRDEWLGPAIPAPRHQAVSIEDARNIFVRTRASQYANGIDNFFRGVAAVLSASPPTHAQFRVDSAFPVNHQNDLTSLGIHVGNNFVN